MIKIDVEGCMFPVIKGGIKSLRGSPALVLIVEFIEEKARQAGFSLKKYITY
jgi:hypothetical protein